MPGWLEWLLLGLFAWLLASVALSLVLARVIGAVRIEQPEEVVPAEPLEIGELDRAGQEAPRIAGGRLRILLVDDDPLLRLLLRTTLTTDEFEVQEAASAEQAADIARFWRPTLVLLDVGLPGLDGLAFCAELKRKPVYSSPVVILLTGEDASREQARAAGADAILRKPFSPLELVGLIDRLTSVEEGLLIERAEAGGGGEQLIVYARDLARLVEVERTQRRLLQHAYRQTVIALTDALEARDPVTGDHALRVQRYALELTEEVDRSLLDDPGLEYGFLLHDIGKIGMPDRILNKPEPLTKDELRLVQQHTSIGVAILSDVPLLEGQGIKVVRSHHERWDGSGYPDRLAEEQIPAGARIFALADALDAMTSDRPYRRALRWEEAVDDILGQNGRQFDPTVVSAFAAREGRLREIFQAHRAAGL